MIATRTDYFTHMCMHADDEFRLQCTVPCHCSFYGVIMKTAQNAPGKRMCIKGLPKNTNFMRALLLVSTFIWVYLFLKPFISNKKWNGLNLFMSFGFSSSNHIPRGPKLQHGVYISSPMVPSLESVEWNTEVRQSAYNKLPAVLSYGLVKNSRRSFQDPILYADSHRYSIFDHNKSIHFNKNHQITRRRRDMPKCLKIQQTCCHRPELINLGNIMM